MQAPSHFSRIDLAQLRCQIEKDLGPEKASYYFSYLNRFLSQRLSKAQFNKFCSLILGPENIHLHNQLIFLILKNACLAKSPPFPCHGNSLVKHDREAIRKCPAREDGLYISQPPTSSAIIWSNGNVLPQSPRRSKSGVRRPKDRPSSFGPNGRADTLAPECLLPFESSVRENGKLTHCHLRRPIQQQSDIAEQPTKRPRIDPQMQDDLVTTNCKSLTEVVTVENAEKADHTRDPSSSWMPLQAPLGIPFCPASVGGARRPFPLSTAGGTTSFPGYYCSGELCHTEVLKKRMEEIAETQGLDGVTIDCANLLNKGLDAYLKRLINYSVQLVCSRSGKEATKQAVSKQQPHGKVMNDVWPGSCTYVNNSGCLEGLGNSKSLISLLDFKVAMELNPQQLGEDWPLLLEKISLCSVE